jgi:hypothetical protein
MESRTYGTVPGELDMAIRRSLQGELDKRVAGGEARDDGLKKSNLINILFWLAGKNYSGPNVSVFTESGSRLLGESEYSSKFMMTKT